ncbi:MAG: hypothetical protein OMM_07059 [Candidatus Magnetoglobus multicellularis str. Araruama]|uniref:Uncharacterized protein n=1 Tax=Candidatus Magnetoglobus multicellularis str. Araruama TaxID=890399 RepID=A0A1V1PEG8_9BACT|nr:MAG: hypothetical protein OMM_07059 [Candidatus Magnetoglobus multicellularis str. Araruama]
MYRDYLIILKNEITQNLEVTIGECQGKKEICEELFNDYCINHAPDYIKNKFEYEDQFRSNLNDNRCEYYVLGLLKAHKHQRLKQNIIQYIQKKVPRAYEPVKNPGIKWLE